MQRYDLVIEDADGKFWRVQVETGWVDEGLAFIRFNTASSYNRTVQYKGRRNYRGQCKYFAVYALALNKVYFIPVDAVGKTNTTLRLTPSKNKQEKNVRWARDYELWTGFPKVQAKQQGRYFANFGYMTSYTWVICLPVGVIGQK